MKVEVILEERMAKSSEAAVSAFHKHRIFIRYSHPAILMHHKFAIIDGPERVDGECDSVSTTDTSQPQFLMGGRNSWDAHSRLSDLWTKNRVWEFAARVFHRTDSEPVNAGVLVTGSFNWTWSAVVNNHENVIITNEPKMVECFAREFQNLWQMLKR